MRSELHSLIIKTSGPVRSFAAHNPNMELALRLVRHSRARAPPCETTVNLSPPPAAPVQTAPHLPGPPPWRRGGGGLLLARGEGPPPPPRSPPCACSYCETTVKLSPPPAALAQSAPAPGPPPRRRGGGGLLLARGEGGGGSLLRRPALRPGRRQSTSLLRPLAALAQSARCPALAWASAAAAPVVKGAAAASSAACSASFRYGTLPGPPGQPSCWRATSTRRGACAHRGMAGRARGACDGRDVIAAALLSVLQQQTLPGDAGRPAEPA